jgi:uncharacterized protein (TIGR00369 family)
MTQTQPESRADIQADPQAHPRADVDAGSRERTYTWQDPAPTLEALLGRPGIEVLLAMGTGELPVPPIMDTMAFEGFSAEVGHVRFTLVPREFHYNPLGTVHGGVIATLLDSAAGCAVHSVLPAGEGYTSVDLVTKYLRPVTSATGEITAEGTVISRGSRTALAEARLTDARGRLLAHATSTCLIFPIPPRS